MGRWPWAGAGCAHGTPWEPRFDRDPDRRGDWETRWTTLRSLHGKCNPMEPLLDTIPNSNIGSTSYPDPPATSFAFLETWTVDDRCLMTPISYQDVNSCGSISWKSCSGIERIYEYTLREEKHGCGRFALRWKIYARRNIDGNLREFSNLNGKSSLEIRVTTSRGRRKHCHGWWTSHRAPGKNLLPVPVSQDRWERSRREAGEKVSHRWKRRFSRSGSGSLVPMGKMVPRLLRLLHTLIYFKRGGKGHPFLPRRTSPFHGSLRWVLTLETPSKDSSTCLSMETGYLPVTFCGKISSAADPVAFVRGWVIVCGRILEFRPCSLRGWVLCIVLQKKIDPFFDSCSLIRI